MSNIQIETVSVPGQQEHDVVFPLAYVLKSENSTLEDTHAWIHSQRDHLMQQVAQHGAILFRGFPVDGAEDFDSVIRSFGLDSFTYQESLSNAVRVNRTELVFTANEAPPEVSIFLHHEMAQTPLFPSMLFFCC